MKTICYTQGAFRFLERGWTEKPSVPHRSELECLDDEQMQDLYIQPMNEYENQHTKDLADSVVIGNDAHIPFLDLSLGIYDGDLLSVQEGYRVEIVEVDASGNSNCSDDNVEREVAYLVPLEQPKECKESETGKHLFEGVCIEGAERCFYCGAANEQPGKEESQEERLIDFLTWVEKNTYYFEDKDVTPSQVVNEYLNRKPASHE